MRLFYYKERGCFYASGPIRAEDEQAARKRIRSLLQVKTLRGVEVWETSQAALDAVGRCPVL